jgi:glucuronokinase
MRLIRKRAYARAGLIGNPSDGYHGKTISLIVRNFWAEASLYEWEDVELLLSQDDRSRFGSITELVRDVERHGYYGGIRLVKATVKRFAEYCRCQGRPLHDRNFSIRYESNIPRQVGLSGSSAIVVATLRCLMEYYDIAIPEDVQPSLALAVETEELGLPAGLQDRVIQVFEGLVYMDFARERMAEKHGYACGAYERLDPLRLPPLYIACRPEAAKPRQAGHDDVRVRFRQGEPKVVAAMKKFADLTVQARAALEAGDAERLGRLMDANFDTRREIYDIREDYRQMVECARGVGASAKFAGSGGAVIGTYRDEAMFQALERAYAGMGCRVFKPLVREEGP